MHKWKCQADANIKAKAKEKGTKHNKWAANQQNGMCAQPRLRSAWASAHSDQSLPCLHEESLGP